MTRPSLHNPLPWKRSVSFLCLLLLSLEFHQDQSFATESDSIPNPHSIKAQHKEQQREQSLNAKKQLEERKFLGHVAKDKSRPLDDRMRAHMTLFNNKMDKLDKKASKKRGKQYITREQYKQIVNEMKKAPRQDFEGATPTESGASTPK